MSEDEMQSQIVTTLALLRIPARAQFSRALGLAVETNGVNVAAGRGAPNTVSLSLDPEDWKCPITLELIFQAAIAEDGRVYESSAIQEHMRVRRARRLDVTSPVTNAPMGTFMVYAPWIMSHIQTNLINQGLVPWEMEEAWSNDEWQ